MINQVFNENAIKTMQRMPDNFVKLTITSPPYEDMRKYKGFDFDFENIAKQLYRVTQIGGCLVWVVGDKTIKQGESGNSFRQALHFMSIGFKLHDTMIYLKDSISFPETTRYSQVFEYMFVFVKGKIKTHNILKDRKNKHAGVKIITGGERQTDGSILKRRRGNVLKEFGSRFNVWEISTGYGKSSKDKIAYKHPAIFPEKLVEGHILTWSNVGDLIYDPFMGSGTVAKMCLLTQRHYIGSEISSEYIEIINERLKPFYEEI